MSKAKEITKSEAVRRAVAEGVDKPQEGSAFIKEKFGLQVTPQHFSTYKSQQKAKEGKGSGGRSKRLKEHERGNGFVPTELMRQMIVLVEEYGKAEVAEALSAFED